MTTLMCKMRLVLELLTNGERTDRSKVDKLATLFSKTYGFKVYNKKLGTTPQKPELQARAHLARFAEKENAEDALLIVYYAGHGSGGHGVKTDDIELAG